ncbi:YfcE family phosphodiesterase [Pedobacter yulinensis]|uniref:YfcE family phosphodiesterase n=1 Tax=Pedobacter yulinensis TaxID=2126353 RepID=A0A2T3HMZ1_9SPHI|nr:YfcE family phosphodiesterase [Pedobacter yulinensis]
MRIALFSDIHANLPALEAFFADVERRQPDMMYCLGDLVGYNIWPNEVIDELRRRRIPTLAGNYDYGVGRALSDCGCAYKTAEEKGMGERSVAFTNGLVDAARRDYLRGLPAHIRLEFPHDQGVLNLLLVHGSPRRTNEYLFEDREEKSMVRIIEQAGADVLCFGHTHRPFHRKMRSDADSRVLHAINTGSVGKPKDGDPRGSYVMLTIDPHRLAGHGGVEAEIVRFTYDVERAAGAIEQSVLPRPFADMLRLGR